MSATFTPSWAPPEEQRTLTQREWVVEGGLRFHGASVLNWRFRCPSCGHVAKVRELKERGQPPQLLGRECLGRYTAAGAYPGTGPGPCDYTCIGLINLAPITVVLPDGSRMSAFAFASARDALGMLLPPTRAGWRLEADETFLRDTVRHGDRIRLIVYEAGEPDRWIMRSGPGDMDDIALRLKGDFHGIADSPEAGMEALDGWVEGP